MRFFDKVTPGWGTVLAAAAAAFVAGYCVAVGSIVIMILCGM